MAKSTSVYDRGETWSHKETLALIEVWGEEAMQHRLMVSNRNMDVFEEIAAAVRLRTGCERTASQCRSRVKRIKSDYSRTLKQSSDGTKPVKKFAFFDELDRIFRARQSMVSDQCNVVLSSSQEIPDELANEENEYLSSSESTTQEQPFDTADTAYPLVVFKVENPELDETGWNQGNQESLEPADPQDKKESKVTKRSLDNLYDSVHRLEEMMIKRARHEEDVERMQKRQDQKCLQQLSEVLERQKLQQGEMTSMLKQLVDIDGVSRTNKDGGDVKTTCSEQSALLTVTQNMVDVVTKLTASWEKLADQQERGESLRREREDRRYNLLKETLEQQRRDEKDMFYKVMDMQMKMFQMFCSSLQSSSSTNAPSVPMASGLPQAFSTGL